MEYLKEAMIILAHSLRGHGGGEGVVAGSQSHGSCRQKAERDECAGKQVLSSLKNTLFIFICYAYEYFACVHVCVCKQRYSQKPGSHQTLWNWSPL